MGKCHRKCHLYYKTLYLQAFREPQLRIYIGSEPEYQSIVYLTLLNLRLNPLRDA